MTHDLIGSVCKTCGHVPTGELCPGALEERLAALEASSAELVAQLEARVAQLEAKAKK